LPAVSPVAFVPLADELSQDAVASSSAAGELRPPVSPPGRNPTTALSQVDPRWVAKESPRLSPSHWASGPVAVTP